MISQVQLTKKKIIIISSIILIFAVFTGVFTAIFLNQNNVKIDTSPEKIMFDRLDSLYRNQNYSEAKKVLQEMNSKYPNSDLVKKANSMFNNLDELIKKDELEKPERDAKAQKAAEEHRQWMKQEAEAAKKLQQERENSIYIGDNREKVLKVFGNPDTINRTVTKNLVHEQWVYGRTYIYLENDRVTSWQDSQ